VIPARIRELADVLGQAEASTVKAAMRDHL
jgi:hypothetical protein